MKKAKHRWVRKTKWRVLWRDLTDDDPDRVMGWCHDSKVIEIDSNLTEGLTAEVALHEFTHAFFPDIAEEVVEIFAKQAVDFLGNIDLIRYEDEEDELR